MLFQLLLLSAGYIGYKKYKKAKGAKSTVTAVKVIKNPDGSVSMKQVNVEVQPDTQTAVQSTVNEPITVVNRGVSTNVYQTPPVFTADISSNLMGYKK